MRTIAWLSVVMVAACGVEGEAPEGAELDAQLREVADLDIVIRYLGTDGEACTPSATTGQVTCVADEEVRPVPIAIGDFAAAPIYECGVQRDGSLADCVEPTAYECDGGDGEEWCGCSGLLDCLNLALSGQCSGPMTCDDQGCVCSNG